MAVINADAFCLNLASFGSAVSDLQVLTSSGEEVYFKIKRNTKLSKLQAAYASKVGKDVGSIRYVHEVHLGPPFMSFSPSVGGFRFLYEGARINDDDTPASLDMEDNGRCGSPFPSQ